MNLILTLLILALLVSDVDAQTANSFFNTTRKSSFRLSGEIEEALAKSAGSSKKTDVIGGIDWTLHDLGFDFNVFINTATTPTVLETEKVKDFSDIIYYPSSSNASFGVNLLQELTTNRRLGIGGRLGTTIGMTWALPSNDTSTSSPRGSLDNINLWYLDIKGFWNAVVEPGSNKFLLQIQFGPTFRIFDIGNRNEDNYPVFKRKMKDGLIGLSTTAILSLNDIVGTIDVTWFSGLDGYHRDLERPNTKVSLRILQDLIFL